MSRATVDGKAEAGRVDVLYGSSTGATSGNCQVVTKGTGAARGGRFGQDLASGDFDGDGHADLASATGTRGGDLTIVFGSDDGLSGEPVAVARPPAGSFGGHLTTGDFNRDGRQDLAVEGADATVWAAYGHRGIRTGEAGWKPVLSKGEAVSVRALATGDVTGDGFADLAVTYSEDDPADEGRSVVYRGSPTGLAGRVRGTFPGWDVGAVAIGDLDGDGHGDVVAGMAWDHGEDPGGQIYVSRGSADGPAAPRAVGPASPGMPQEPRGNGGFGASVAVGDVDADGYADVAVGESERPGVVYVLYGGPGGLSVDGARVLDPGAAGIPSDSASDQRFGTDVALTDLDGDGALELVVTSVSVPADGVAETRVTALFPDGRRAPVQLAHQRLDHAFDHTLE
ncbi:hypothetical protein GCM10017600_02910 [Streptosporangium carneum]|uniref:VCBS repeat-containing protein n=1 Tax=Streptosporangium carneum TaxID=47481 RepID=A0A9W6HV33_9ACTN|nr:hypothetical protein GCM10017600_02910 [Streptosporangium carneum]